MLKDFVRLAAHRSGALRVLQGLNRSRVRILMYHRFPTAQAQNFDRQCAFLAEQYIVVSLAQAVERIQVGAPLDNLAVITIDDGYADVHEVAFPVLRKHKLPALLYVTTGFIEGRCAMPGDVVRRVFAGAAGAEITVTGDDGEVQRFGPGEADRLRSMLKRVPHATRSRMLRELQQRAGVGDTGEVPAAFRPCTWAQLRELAAGDVSLGAHTETHPILSRVETQAEKEREILGSKETLEREIGREVASFAYPNGTPEDMDPVSLGVVRGNFASAVTAIYGLNGAGADAHALLRLPCDPDLPVPALARMMAGPLRRGAQNEAARG